MIPPHRPGLCVLIDRDGTVIRDEGYLSDPAMIRFLPGALDGLATLARAGIPVIGVTNQSGVGRGMFSLAAADAVNAAVSTGVAAAGGRIWRWYVCPHHPDDGCRCRKPRPGLAERARDDFGFDLRRAVVIGDKASDVQLAAAIGGRGVLIAADGLVPSGCAPDFVAGGLAEAAAWVLGDVQPAR